MDSAEEDDIVWAKGDSCLSPYSGDGKLYRAVVKKIEHGQGGSNVKALVQFDGYQETEQEEVPVKKLRRITRCEKEKSLTDPRRQRQVNGAENGSKGFFKPLFGDEEKNWLQEKYSDLEEDDLDVRSQKLSSVIFGGAVPKKGCSSRPAGAAGAKGHGTPTVSRKKAVVTGGEVKPASQRHIKKNVRMTATESSDRTDPVPSTSRQGQFVVDDKQVTGLEQSTQEDDEEDEMEKPRFTFPPVAAKVPYLLSEPGEKPPIQVPATINQYLRDYQREGIKFIYDHYRNNRGGILGDDMGLGKTVQVIGFLAALLGKQGNRVDVMRQKPSFIRQLSDFDIFNDDDDGMERKPFLIIGPGCVLYNWLDEFETWGYFSVRKFHGSDKRACLAEVKKGKVEVVITTFETFREHQEVLNAIDWGAVIADEVHRIKGLKAQTTQALRGIRISCRYGLTGTALQNNLLELWSLADWAQPDCLGRLYDFETEYVHPIERGQKHDASKRELAEARKMKDKFTHIRKTLMLRRTKQIIADQLPKKDDSVVFCRLSQLQTSIYRTILEHPDMQLVLNMDSACDCGSGTAQSKCCYRKTPRGESVKGLMFTFMHLLLKVANHVALLIPTARTSEKQARAARRICQAALSEHPSFVEQTREAAFRTLSDPKFCGKMKVLQGLLSVFHKDHSKILLFSYSTQALDILEHYMMSTGYEYRRIDGSVSAKKRMDIVREFNKDPNIFICLISTKAGGLGLNLTGANRVVIFDPNWNPTHDLQAQDRAYRIGQRRNVNVYRLVSAGTIEENMYLRQIYKQQLLNIAVEDENSRRYFCAVQGDRTQKGELFGIKNMFRLQTGGSCLTMDILKRNERVESGLAGYQITNYIPPVMKVEEESDTEETDTSIHSTSSESEDVFAGFFSSQDDGDSVDGHPPDREDDVDNDVDSMDIEFEKSVTYKSKPENICTPSKVKRTPQTSKPRTRESPASASWDLFSIEDSKPGDVSPAIRVTGAATGSGHRPGRRKQRLQFVEPSPRTSRSVRFNSSSPDQEGTRGRERGEKSWTTGLNLDDSATTDSDDDVPRFDQTLAGTFTDVGAVFDQCGVVHIHENKKVVGGSRAEDHMTRCAITDVYELHQNSQDLAVQCEPLSESSEEEDIPQPVSTRGRQKPVPDHNTSTSKVVGHCKVLIGQTPRAIRMKQCEKMSHYQACSLTDLAELVLRSSVEDRVKLLNSFYGDQDAALKEILVMNPVQKPQPSETKKKSSKSTSKLKTGSRGGRQQKGPAKKSSGKSSGRRGRGLMYSDLTDSESLTEQANPNVTAVEDGDDSSLDVGVKASDMKRKRKATQVVARTPQKNRSATGVRNSKNAKHLMVSPSYMTTDVSHVDHAADREEWMAVDRVKTEDSDILLSQLGKPVEAHSCPDSVDGEVNILSRKSTARGASPKKQASSPIRGSKNSTSSKDDLLDDIFSTSSKSTISKRKPPPNKRKNAVRTNTSGKVPGSDIEDLFSDGSVSQTDEPALDTSTLKDDNYDCFQDPSKWKRRKRKSPEPRRSVVDRLISDSESDYNNLFTTGKLKKKKSDTGENGDVKGCADKPLYITPSLFSL